MYNQLSIILGWQKWVLNAFATSFTLILDTGDGKGLCISWSYEKVLPEESFDDVSPTDIIWTDMLSFECHERLNAK